MQDGQKLESLVDMNLDFERGGIRFDSWLRHLMMGWNAILTSPIPVYTKKTSFFGKLFFRKKTEEERLL